MERGDKMVILDTRTPEEYRRFCIPGGRSLPGGELALRITDVTADLDPDTTVVVNCAGRTRSIIGTRVLQRMGLDREIVGLKNGTSGWVLAGYELESGADRDRLPGVTEAGRAAAEAYADRCAAEDGVRFLDVVGLDALVERSHRESVYFIDVRTAEEYDQGRIAGFRWFPGGQCVQRSDDVAGRQERPHRLLLRRQGPRHSNRFLVSPVGLWGSVRAGRRRRRLGRCRPPSGIGIQRRRALRRFHQRRRRAATAPGRPQRRGHGIRRRRAG